MLKLLLEADPTWRFTLTTVEIIWFVLCSIRGYLQNKGWVQNNITSTTGWFKMFSLHPQTLKWCWMLKAKLYTCLHISKLDCKSCFFVLPITKPPAVSGSILIVTFVCIEWVFNRYFCCLLWYIWANFHFSLVKNRLRFPVHAITISRYVFVMVNTKEVEAFTIVTITVQGDLSSFRPAEVILTHTKKVKIRSEAECFLFFLRVSN